VKSFPQKLAATVTVAALMSLAFGDTTQIRIGPSNVTSPKVAKARTTMVAVLHCTAENFARINTFELSSGM